MELSEAELKLIRRLHQNQKAWRWRRWAFLLAGLLSFAGCIYFFCVLRDTLQPDKMLLMLCTLAIPLASIFLFLGTCAAAYSLVYWRGRPAAKLLLRLVDGKWQS